MIALSRPANKDFGVGFGPRPKPTPTSPAIHYGQDYGWGSGKQIYAAANGVVKSTSYSGAYGNRTVIDHGNGIETWYCHQSAFLVKVGQVVTRGQHIGTMGNTGNALGVHLHFELRINGKATDPAPHMTAALSTSTILEPLLQGDTMNLFHLVTTKGDQAYIYQGAASQQIISGAYLAALEKGYGVKAIQINEYDWDAISSSFTADLNALTTALGVQANVSVLTVNDIAKAVNDDAARRLAN